MTRLPLIEINERKIPVEYKEAAALARRTALTDSENDLRGLPGPPKGAGVEDTSGSTQLNNLTK